MLQTIKTKLERLNIKKLSVIGNISLCLLIAFWFLSFKINFSLNQSILILTPLIWLGCSLNFIIMLAKALPSISLERFRNRLVISLFLSLIVLTFLLPFMPLLYLKIKGLI